MLFCLLPQELVLKVFQHLDSDEARLLAQKLKKFSKNENAARAISLLYIRLYLGCTVVIGRKPTLEYDAVILPEDLVKLTYDDQFLSIIPKLFDISFTWGYNLAQFHRELKSFLNALKSRRFLKYLDKLPEIHFEIHGLTVISENATLVHVAVLDTLIKLTTLDKIQLKSIDITFTDIGDVMPDKWAHIFGRFTKATHLNLMDNNLRLEYTSEYHALLEQHFRWPPNLRYLTLSHNYIKTFTAEFARKLPSTVEHIELGYCLIETIGLPYHESFSVVKILPNLRYLVLDGNKHLVYVDPNLLAGAEHFFELLITGCNIAEQLLDLLCRSARENNVRLACDLFTINAERRDVLWNRRA